MGGDTAVDRMTGAAISFLTCLLLLMLTVVIVNAFSDINRDSDGDGLRDHIDDFDDDNDGIIDIEDDDDDGDGIKDREDEDWFMQDAIQYLVMIKSVFNIHVLLRTRLYNSK